MLNPTLGADAESSCSKAPQAPFSAWIPPILTDAHLSVLRWVVPGTLSAIVIGYELWEHHPELATFRTFMGAHHFQWEVSFFGLFWPSVICLLLTWLLHHWRKRTEATEALQALYLELTQAHGELAYLDQERTALLRRQVQILEEERQRVAVEIHDELGSMLTRLNTDLNMIRGRQAGPPTEVDLQIEACRDLIGLTVDRAHDICVSLRPLLLDQLGLRAALQSEARTRLAPNGLTWHLVVQGCLDGVPPDVALTVFRIAQEAFSNILRHAHATHVEIYVEQTSTALNLKIVDDGVGLMAAEPATPRYSLGLVGMRERAQAVGGVACIHNAPVQGVEVDVQLPL